MSTLTDQGYLEDVLSQVEKRIVDRLQMNRDMVYPTMDPDKVPDIKRGQVIFTVCPEDFSVDQPQFAGGGRNTFVVEGVLVVNLWMRMNMDRPKDASQFLKEPNRGAFVKLRALINALTWDGANLENNWQVKDQETGVPLWVEPARLLRVRLVRGQSEPDLRRAETTWELKVKLQLP